MRYVHSRPLPRPRSVCTCSMESGNHYVSTGYETGSESSHVRPQSIISYAVMKTRSVPSRNAMSRNITSRADEPYIAGPRTLGRRHSDGANFDAYTDSIQDARVTGTAPTPEHDRPAPQLNPYVRCRRSTFCIPPSSLTSFRLRILHHLSICWTKIMTSITIPLDLQCNHSYNDTFTPQKNKNAYAMTASIPPDRT